jgi:hypothetical protein
VHTYNSSTKEAEDQEYKASLGYIWKLCLKKKKKERKKKKKAGHWWLTPIIPAAQETEIRRIMV